MELTQTIIQKTFYVEHEGRTYYVDFIDSDGHTLGLLNRNNWEIIDEDHEELQIWEFRSNTKENIKIIKENQKLSDKLIEFCIKNFNKYDPFKEGDELEAEAKKGEIKLRKK